MTNFIVYDIIQNCFIGREGFKKTLDPKCEMTQKLLDGGYIKAPENKMRKLKTEKK
jgi:hypothetical protein